MDNKDRYRQICQQEEYKKYIPVFSMPAWLDSVSEHWDVCLTEEDSFITGALPYCWKGNFLTKRIYLPELSFYQSVLLFQKPISPNSKTVAELFSQLPKTIKSYFKFLPAYYPIDLSKKGYTREDYTTYTITSAKDLSLSDHHKRHIKKGTRNTYQIKESNDTGLSYELLTATFGRQQVKARISLEEFSTILRVSKKYRLGKCLDCVDTNGNLLASVFLAEDDSTVYYLMGGYNSAYRNSGAMTFLLHHCISETLQKSKAFNFCGSSKKTIAGFFEGFGALKTTIPIWKKIL